MQTVKTCLLLLIISVCLGACGLKGPLYLPDESATKPTGSSQDSTSEAPGDKETTKKKDGLLR